MYICTIINENSSYEPYRIYQQISHERILRNPLRKPSLGTWNCLQEMRKANPALLPYIGQKVPMQVLSFPYQLEGRNHDARFQPSYPTLVSLPSFDDWC